MRINNRHIFTTATIVCIVAVVSCTHKSKESTIPAPAASFRSDIVPILTAKCALNAGCHLGTANSGNNINLDSNAAYTNIINRHLVITTAPTSSLLYVEINSGGMPKTPYAKLSAAEITWILNWITQGAKNN